jgi:hypothetical protein
MSAIATLNDLLALTSAEVAAWEELYGLGGGGLLIARKEALWSYLKSP